MKTKHSNTLLVLTCLALASANAVAQNNIIVSGNVHAGNNVTAGNTISGHVVSASSHVYTAGYVQTANGASIGTHIVIGAYANIGTDLKVNGRAEVGDNSSATGSFSAALGEAASAPAYSSVVIGRFNELEGTTDEWIDTEPLFVVANGADVNDRNNALTIRKNGDVVLGKAQGDILMGQFGQ